MDFLRRLHPSHAEAPGAVRPDLGAWRASGLPRRVVDGDSPGPSRPVAQADASVEATPRPAAGMPAPAAAAARLPPVAASTAPIASSRSGSVAPVAPGGLPPVAATGPSEAAVGAAVAMPSSPATRAATAGARQVLPAVAHASGRPSAEGVRGAVAAKAPAAAAWPTRGAASPPPLRAGVQPLQRLAEPAAPAIVQVTIDRIDVRLPPERGAADAPRRARPAPTLALADYLREREGGRR